MNDKCPRCEGVAFSSHDCGPDGYDDDITYTSFSCDSCGLWQDGWTGQWLIDVETCSDENDAEEFTAT